jgi:hypothetical protein
MFLEMCTKSWSLFTHMKIIYKNGANETGAWIFNSVFFFAGNRKVTSTVKRTHRYTLLASASWFALPHATCSTHQPVIDMRWVNPKSNTHPRDKSNLIVLLVTMCATLHLKASLEIEARQCAYQDEGRGFERSPTICYRHFRRAPTPFQMAIIGRFHVFLPGLCPRWFLVGLFYFVRSRIRPANLYQLQLASGETFDS